MSSKKFMPFFRHDRNLDAKDKAKAANIQNLILGEHYIYDSQEYFHAELGRKGEIK